MALTSNGFELQANPLDSLIRQPARGSIDLLGEKFGAAGRRCSS